MIFSYTKKKRIIDLLPVCLAVFVGVLVKSAYTYFMILTTIIWFIKYFPSSYIIEDNMLIIKKFRKEKFVSVDSLKYIRKVHSSTKETSDDKWATYLISGGDEYVVLNTSTKNKEGKTIIDVLNNDYQIPIKNEKSKSFLFVKTRIEDN